MSIYSLSVLNCLPHSVKLGVKLLVSCSRERQPLQNRSKRLFHLQEPNELFVGPCNSTMTSIFAYNLSATAAQRQNQNHLIVAACSPHGLFPRIYVELVNRLHHLPVLSSIFIAVLSTPGTVSSCYSLQANNSF